MIFRGKTVRHVMFVTDYWCRYKTQTPMDSNLIFVNGDSCCGKATYI